MVNQEVINKVHQIRALLRQARNKLCDASNDVTGSHHLYLIGMRDTLDFQLTVLREIYTELKKEG